MAGDHPALAAAAPGQALRTAVAVCVKRGGGGRGAGQALVHMNRGTQAALACPKGANQMKRVPNFTGKQIFHT